MDNEKKGTKTTYNDINELRFLMQKIYLYGCYTHERLTTENIQSDIAGRYLTSIRSLYFSYDKEKSSLEAIRPHGDKRQGYRLKRDCFRSSAYQNAAIFGMYSVSENIIRNNIVLMSLISSEKEGLCFSDIEEKISIFNKEGIEKSTVKQRCKDLTEAGYVVKKSVGKNRTRYVLARPFSGFTNTELSELYFLASFMAGKGYPRLDGIRLENSLKREMLMRNMELPPEIFMFRDSPCGNILDEELAYRLLECCAEGLKARIVYENGTICDVSPAFLRVDPRYGRWYLFAECDRNPRIFRISRLRSVMKTSDTFDRDAVGTKVRESMKNLLFSGGKGGAAIRVEAELHFTDDGQRASFEKEMVTGKIVTENGKEIYRAELSDPLEIKPFLRSYCDSLRLLPCRNRMCSDLNREILGMVDYYHNGKLLPGTEKGTKHSGEKDPAAEEKQLGKKKKDNLLFTWRANNEFRFLSELMCRDVAGLDSAERKKIAVGCHVVNDDSDTNDPLRKWSDDEEVFIAEGDRYRLNPELRRFAVPPDWSEMRYLRYILSAPEARLFTGVKPERAAAAPTDNILTDNILDYIDCVQTCGKSRSVNEISADIFKVLLRAISERRYVFLSRKDAGEGEKNTETVVPFRIEHNACSGDFRLIAYRESRKESFAIDFRSIEAVSANGRHNVSEDEIKESILGTVVTEKAILKVSSVKDTQERFFIVFENMPDVSAKTVPTEGGTDEFEIHLGYFRSDEEEVVKKLLLLGENVRLISGSDSLRSSFISKLEQAAKLIDGAV